jgi:hypothetical protein
VYKSQSGRSIQDKLAATVTEAVQRALTVKLLLNSNLSLRLLLPRLISCFPNPHHNQAEAKEGEALVDVTVIAHAVEKVDYYENGEHF